MSIVQVVFDADAVSLIVCVEDERPIDGGGLTEKVVHLHLDDQAMIRVALGSV